MITFIPDHPVPGNVREGVIYADGALIGELAAQFVVQPVPAPTVAHIVLPPPIPRGLRYV
ncbi:MAG: hypothetical protein U1D97_06665 [Desulfuromonadales bacterium]|nr:hypothetical protein [Desulfuromonadales bacterium]